MDDLLTEFLTETSEAMDTLDIELVKLEQDPNDPELLSNIFRMVHTVKGTCGFLGLPRLEAVAHASENVLGKVRDGELEVTPQAVSLILESLDQIKALCAELEATEQEPDGNDAELIRQLNALADGEAGGETAAPAAAVAAPAPAAAEATGDETPVVSDAGFPVAAELLAEYEAVGGTEPASGEDASVAPVEIDEVVTQEIEAVAEEPVVDAAVPASEAAGAAASADKPKRDAGVAAQSIRVNVDVLENLMTMVSELVLSRNQLMQIHRARDDSDDFAAPLQTLNHIVSELQEGVMQTRMQPIGSAWAKLPRIVRDLSLELGKKIELRMMGQDTELDRQVLELIRDPLTHMVRNSADHAIEEPAGRRAAGKSEVGTITLNAFHEGGHIIIEIRDDGAGLNVEKLKAKILANELATESEIEGLSDSQIHHYIFKAGFSTAAAVTSVSGRGVGMDVVRTNIEKIGGTIELQSEFGKGTAFKIKIPLTLAIVSALIVECGGEKFAVPQLSVLELVRASRTSDMRIETINSAPVLRLRDRLLPLVSLREQLHLAGLDIDAVSLPKAEAVERPSAAAEMVDEPNAYEDAADRPTEDIADQPSAEAEAADGGEKIQDGLEDAFIIVTQVGPQIFGIIVDRVFDTEEIVVKPVAPILRDIQLFSGNTILGDGSVIMILDTNGIAAASGEMSLQESADQAADEVHANTGQDKTAMLVFHAVDGGPKAVPLALVARLEEIDVDTLERSDGRCLVQYRGQLMPVVNIEAGQKMRETGRQPMLVFTDGQRSMGLVVDQIDDIVEAEISVEIASQRDGVIGSAVISGKATDVIDTGYFLVQAFPDWFEAQESNELGEHQSKRVLLVDDSAFFRNMITPLLEVAGYRVTTTDSAQAALDLCERGLSFDVIVSDIEMPGMTGFEFAEKVKTESAWRETPIVALSARATPRDLDRGREAGFTDYVGKFDRDALLVSLSQTLGTRGAA